MDSGITPARFLQKLNECVKEYRKQLNQTRDEEASAQYFDSNLKRFLIEYKNEIQILSNMNFEKPFMTFLKLYLYKKGS